MPVEWLASDPDGDPTRVSLFIDADGDIDEDTIALDGYDDLDGEAGRANAGLFLDGDGLFDGVARNLDAVSLR